VAALQAALALDRALGRLERIADDLALLAQAHAAQGDAAQAQQARLWAERARRGREALHGGDGARTPAPEPPRDAAPPLTREAGPAQAAPAQPHNGVPTP
jgi:hypothetical protein